MPLRDRLRLVSRTRLMDNDGRAEVRILNEQAAVPAPMPGRILSVDLFRGVVMFLLIGEATGLYEFLASPSLGGSLLGTLGLQFQHHPWHGLRLWDLGLPFFMFISGVALVFSFERRWERGETWRSTLGHAAGRAAVLFASGWVLARISPIETGGGGEFLLDVLPQLAFGGFLAFLMLRKPAWLQAAVALGLLALTEGFYRIWRVPGFDRPFVPGKNPGSYLDMALFGRQSEGNWVTFNIVPAAAFIFAGILAGRWLKQGGAPQRTLRGLVLAGLLGVGAGLAMDPLTPVVRRLCTSSFVILSAGLACLCLALGFWLKDMLRIGGRGAFFVCVGMNPLFIYLFAYSGGAEWLRQIVEPFTWAFAGPLGRTVAELSTGLAVWGGMWGLCRWLYAKRIVIKI